MSVVLVLGLMPLPAYADTGGSQALAAGGALQTQANASVTFKDRSWDGSKVVAEDYGRCRGHEAG